MKRMISLLLVLAMLAGYLPVMATAEETEGTESAAVTEETTVIMEAATEPSEEVTESAETKMMEEPMAAEIAAEETVGSEILSGSCGDNLVWTLDAVGLLTISGTGAMYNYSTGNDTRAPWYEERESILGVRLDSGVTSIGNYSFYGCAILTSVEMSNSITNIGPCAFSNCKSLVDIVFSNQLKSISHYAFGNCDRLNRLVIPDGVTTIGLGAFADCDKLMELVIPGSVSSIETEICSDCTSLTMIQVSPDNAYFCNDNTGSLFTKDKEVLIQVPGGWDGKYTIPDGVDIIAAKAFSGCTGLRKVTIPDSVTGIGGSAFKNCTGLTSLTIPGSVWEIGTQAFNGCNGLTKIYFQGSAPSFGRYVFSGVTATVYYPENDDSWTSVMESPNLSGTITWVPYPVEDDDTIVDDDVFDDDAFDDDDTPEEPVEYHNTLAELTDLDYLAFAQASYSDFKCDPNQQETLQEGLERLGKWNSVWGYDGITYAELCESVAKWKVMETKKNNKTGFYAVAFCNDQGEAVIAYRGSHPPVDYADDPEGFWKDWWDNDLKMIIFNYSEIQSNQYYDAKQFYLDVTGEENIHTIKITGHSLGGLWGDVMSAQYGCEAITFNAISALDMMYMCYPHELARNFRGIDAWNFTEHACEYDIAAGVSEELLKIVGLATKVKPYIAHKSNYGALSVGNNHSMKSIVSRTDDGIALNARVGSWTATKGKSAEGSYLLNSLVGIDMGVRNADSFERGLYMPSMRFSYGGDSGDDIASGLLSDILIGGRGDDRLDGGWGDDDYYYYKGDGCDTIVDIGGDDRIWLWDFDEDDYIEAYEDAASDYISILCNGTPIIKILKKNREYELFTLNSFKYIVNDGEAHNFTELFDEHRSGLHAVIRCPVSIEILDAEGSTVYALENSAVGYYYTDYGNFYVFEEEDGGYGKVLDLAEGYTARIVGEDTGTMAIEYYPIEEGAPAEAKSFADVPVSEQFIATFEQTNDGELVLAADTDGDNIVDAKIGYDGKVIPVESVTLSQEYVVLKPQASTQIFAEVQPAELADMICWSVEAGGEEIISVDTEGNVTAYKTGTAYVLATVTNGESSVTARCRVDVAETETVEAVQQIRVDGIQLGTAKATSELNSTAYAELEVLLKLPQNMTQMSAGRNSQIPENLGVAIESARFTDETMAKYFILIPQDDRTLVIVPTDYAISNPKEVKSSYKSTVAVTVEGKEHLSEILSLSVKKSVPKLKVTVPAFNSFYAGQTQDLVITGATVTSIEALSIPNWLTLEGQTLSLMENAPAKNLSGKASLLIYTEEWRIPAEISLSVKNSYKAAALKLSASSVTLNTSVKDSAVVTVTANPTDYDISEATFRLTDSAGKVDKTGELTVAYENGEITVGATEKTKGNYKLFVSIGAAKEAALTVKTVSKEPSVSFTVKGNPDINIPGSVAQITPTFKNYSGDFTLVDEEDQQINLTQTGKTIRVSAKGGTAAGSYTLTLKLELADGTVITDTAKVKVKETTLKLKLSASKLVLNKAIGDVGDIEVTSATKGYTVTAPVWSLMDKSGKNPSDGKLDISWNNGKLTVATNDLTAYGATYKLLIKAGEDHPAKTLTITIPAQNKSTVTATLKASGKIDVIRDGSSVTVTPAYKNSNAQTEKTERLAFYKEAGKTLEPADDLFTYESNGNGGYTVTKAKGAKLNHSGKYRVELVAVFGKTYEVRSNPVTISVKQGSAKVKLTEVKTTLFSRDKYDRAEFVISGTDGALNAIKTVEIKDSKYENILEIIDYGNGEYAIGFPEGKADSSLIGKTITVNFNIYFEGNETAKANTTAKMKITVLK